MITIVIAVLNGEKWIKKAIESFLSQRGKKELLIIDSGNDKTEEIVLSYKDKEIKYYKVKFHGIFEKQNFGLKLAKGDIFGSIGCDDQLVDGCFKIIEKEIKGFDLIIGDLILIDEKGNEIEKIVKEPFNLMKYRFNNIVASCSAFVKTDFLRKNGIKFNPRYRFNADYDFYLRIAHLSLPKQIHNFLSKFMIRADSVSGGKNEKQASKDRIEISEKIRNEFPMLDHPRILVAVCNEGWIRPELAAALYQISNDQRVKSKIIFPNRKTYENNLSHIVLKVKQEKWDYLLIIDADNPPLKNPIDLIELNLDVVGCPTPQWNDVDSFPIYWVAMDKVEGGYKPHKEMTGLQEVDAVGTGCMLIKRKVLESLKAPFTRIWNKDGTMNLGVDFHFCEQAKDKGFKIYAHYDYICDHFKELSLLKVLEFKNK